MLAGLERRARLDTGHNDHHEAVHEPYGCKL